MFNEKFMDNFYRISTILYFVYSLSLPTEIYFRNFYIQMTYVDTVKEGIFIY